MSMILARPPPGCCAHAGAPVTVRAALAPMPLINSRRDIASDIAMASSLSASLDGEFRWTLAIPHAHCIALLRVPQGALMTAITLDQANRIIAAILKRGAEINCRPLSVIVVEPGCKVKAFQKEDGSSMIRFEMAYGKAYAALAMGRSSKLVKVRAEEKP